MYVTVNGGTEHNLRCLAVDCANYADAQSWIEALGPVEARYLGDAHGYHGKYPHGWQWIVSYPAPTVPKPDPTAAAAIGAEAVTV